eukprot:129272_1
MATAPPKKRVKDIAALFGEQISTKKVKTRNLVLERRNSDTLRRHRRKLRTTKSSKCDAIEPSSSNTMDTPFDPSYQAAETQSLTEEIRIQPTLVHEPYPDEDSDASDMDDTDSMDDMSIDIDQFINDTYGGWRQWSHSSYLSSMDVSEAVDARDSVCADSDSATEDIDTHDIDTNSIQNNERLSQQILWMAHDDPVVMDRDMLERLNHLEEVGATRTRNYLINLLRTNSTASASDLTIPTLIDTDDDYMTSDCDDTESTDDESEPNQILHTQTKNQATVHDLLDKFGINACLYAYFEHTLDIHYVSQMVDVSPTKIRKPDHVSAIQTLMKLNKMCKYVSIGVMHGLWDGSMRKEWIELEYNSLFDVYQHSSSVMRDYNDCIIHNAMDRNHPHQIQLSGYQKRYFAYVDLNTWDNEEEMTFKVVINELPDAYRFEAALCKIGVEWNNESLYITDRLCIRHNEAYVSSLYVGSFVERGSEIVFKLCKESMTSADDDSVYLNMNICHDPKGQRTTMNHRTLTKDFRMKMDMNSRASMKLFIAQYRGNGEYVCA